MSKLLTALDIGDMANIDAFAGVGIVHLRYQGEVREIPLETRGWEQVRDAYKKKFKHPEPPYTDEIIRKDSPEARAFNAKGPSTVRRYDPLNADYLEKIREWNVGLYYWLTAHCLKLELKNGDVPITDIEKRVEALKKIGVSAKHVDSITDRINELDDLAEEEAVGFGEGDSGQKGS